MGGDSGMMMSDAETPDSGSPDAGTLDSGTPDSGTPDSGTPDSGTPDSGTPDAGATAPPAVYTLSNDTSVNEIDAYSRDATTGALTMVGSYPTGGTGTGMGLGSQGALVFDASQNRFFAVNPGDDTISMMALQDDGSVMQEANVDSGGTAPISITVHGNVVYVLNAGDSGSSTPANISGFRISGSSLSPIADSSRPLSLDNPGPAQIQFNADGSLLVVTEKGTSKIDTYTVDSGVATGPIVHPSSGMTPFGFTFSSDGHLVVSDAFGGADNMGAASTYEVGTLADGLTAVSSSVESGQTAPCWVAVAGTHAYVTNTASNNVTGYSVSDSGALTLLWSAPTGMHPIDEALTPANDYLYVLNAGDHSFSIYAVDSSTGAVTQQPDYTGLSATATGVAVGPSAVYTMSNDASANEIDAYVRAADGSLSSPSTYSTGGMGKGMGLGSQGSLVLDASHTHLFAVNFGDNTISMFTVGSAGALTLDDQVDSGGIGPVSVAVHGSTVYVVDAGDTSTPANIAGFQVSGTSLTAISGSSRPLSADAPAPAQIGFDADGSALFVTEKGTSRIDGYALSSGLPSQPSSAPSSGKTPFGFALSANGQLIVSEAFMGMTGMGATSSYSVTTAGTLSPVTDARGSGQSAPCWVAMAGDVAYITNTRSNNLSAYRMASDGSLTYLWSAAAGMNPIDEAVSADEGFLYVLNAMDHSFSIYAVDTSTGVLMQKPAFTGVPDAAVGVVAR